MIEIHGNFSPLMKDEKDNILKILQDNQNQKLIIKAKDDHFLEVLKDEFKDYSNIVFEGESLESIELKTNYKYHLDDFYAFSEKSQRFIFENRAYLEELIEPMVSKKRFLHIQSVADTCIALARIHHVDKKKAYEAGILHDILKNYSEEAFDSYLKRYDPKHLNAPFPIKHAYVAKYYLQEHLNYQDEEVLNAIYHHADGLEKTKLGMILYIADKREPLRKIDDGILDLAKIDLNEAFIKLKKDVELYIRNKNNV